ncbi:TetR/AcrR family transcriptional regulator [Phocaeicola vulgatus]|uniref:TetR/AcrR family transcriptional regulator n=1 Tax=Phocaeicola vulgatus TaxID=821 RepID=UPI000E545E0B|nr:TetR/AcrR family transcriptional regulator [Phocaeicola vulgatus]RHM25263.1 TetR/AcrR family transcriptional regulator [Phocaeicola vulgatus]RHM38419.1 TetR/AcrR family transcriptional regulator [Phocaeicola vulgatus]
MKERRKRRSAKDIEESILDAANQLIENDGFSKLTVTGIIHLAEIEPVQFYHRYEDLNKFIDEYVKKYDYWFNDIIKSQKQSSNDKELYTNILTGLFHSLSENKAMQELLKWELANNNETSQRTARLRELHTLPLCQKYSKLFSDTDIDIVTISALIIGGIYYLILHDELSTFSGINLKMESDRQRVIYNPQIQISAESETKRSIFREKDKTKRSKKESAQHSKSRNKSFVMTSVSAL